MVGENLVAVAGLETILFLAGIITFYVAVVVYAFTENYEFWESVGSIGLIELIAALSIGIVVAI